MAPHSDIFCMGNCSEHPLLVGEALEIHIAIFVEGRSWYSLVVEDEAEVASKETLDQKLARKNKEAAEEALKALSIASYEMQTHADLMAIKARHGLKKTEAAKKIQKPCKWLYCDEKAPKIKGKDGKLFSPSTSCVMSECWAYEYLDPKTKTKKKPHTCPYLHPNEEGWCNEWLKNKLFDPSATSVQNRFAALKK
jgi:hypothetical protein